MRLSNVMVFDENIKDTSGVWRSSDDFNDALGAGDILAVQASVTNVSGTSPTLTVGVEHSADGQNWITGPDAISIGIVNNTGYAGSVEPSALYVPLGYVRLKITLGGTSPACRARITVTSRSY
jgi:hypothetical protein